MKGFNIEKYTNYTIYENGDVYSLKTNKILKLSDNGNGYKKVTLNNGKNHVQVYIHRLVAKYFVPNPKKYQYVDHIDRNKDNNHKDNLRWVTAKENTLNTNNQKRYSVSRKGYKHHSEELKVLIKDLYNNGTKVMELSRKFNIPRQTITSILKNIKFEKL